MNAITWHLWLHAHILTIGIHTHLQTHINTYICICVSGHLLKWSFSKTICKAAAGARANETWAQLSKTRAPATRFSIRNHPVLLVCFLLSICGLQMHFSRPHSLATAWGTMVLACLYSMSWSYNTGATAFHNCQLMPCMRARACEVSQQNMEERT